MSGLEIGSRKYYIKFEQNLIKEVIYVSCDF